MSRRNVTYAVLLITSFVVAACAQPLAPRAEDSLCKSYDIASGRCIAN